jgi:Icc-related predicted phosphoesterase
LKLLSISDVVNRRFYSDRIKDFAGDADLIVSCGDLPAYYLDFIASSLCKPLFYVFGNHDHYQKENLEKLGITDNCDQFQNNRLIQRDLGFGINLDNKIEIYKGVIFAGLEGSMLYNYGEHQYSENQMFSKILKLSPALGINKILKGRCIDVLVTHAPPFGIHDGEDRAHTGFKSFLSFIKAFRPKYLLHGHTHLYDKRESRIGEYYGTKIINCYDFQKIDLDLS